MELNNERKTTLFINPLFGKHLSCSYRTVKRIGDLLYIGTMEQGIICFNTVTKQFSRFMDIELQCDKSDLHRWERFIICRN